MQRKDELGRWLRSVPAGKPSCVFADDVEDTRNTIEQLVTSEREPARVVALTWTEVPPLGNEIGLLVEALARATLDSFPFLYGTRQEVRERWSESDVETSAHDAARQASGVLRAASRQILLACYRGNLPLVRRLSHSELVHQLALAIEPHRLLVLIAVMNSTTDGVRLRALSQGAEWLATNSRCRVILALPEDVHEVPELDHVSYGACHFAGDRAGTDADRQRSTIVASSQQARTNEVARSASAAGPEPPTSRRRAVT